MSVWDEPDLRVGGEYVKFEKVGDSIAGTVTAVRAHRFDDGSVAPQVLLTTDDGEDKIVTCGAVRLKMAMAEQRPEPGDHVRIELSEEEKRAGGKTLRHWNVVVTRGDNAPAAPPAAAGEAKVDTAAAAAALANLTPEQKAALGIPA